MSRLDKIKEQNPELNVSLLDIITSVEPTDSYKYVQFLVKVLKDEYLKKGNYDAFYKGICITLFGYDNLSSLVDFEKHSRANRIEKPDIGTYRNFEDITTAVKKADDIVRLKEVEKQVKKLYETDTWLVLIPLSYEASKVYGSNTKWCTTQQQHWNNYRSRYKLIYIINKRTNGKWAVSCDSHGGAVQGWLANDKESSPFNFPLPPDIFGILAEEVQKSETVDDLSKNKEIEGVIKKKDLTVGEYTQAISSNNGASIATMSGNTSLDLNQLMDVLGVDLNQVITNSLRTGSIDDRQELPF